tara:strand:+ start:410 stop:562 length:153 start_codon:yes stop_codon:yes gene_type:complete
VDELLYILVGSFLIGLFLLYRIEKPTKTPKNSVKIKKPTIWFKDGKEFTE